MPRLKKSTRADRDEALCNLLLRTPLDIAGIAKVLNHPNQHVVQMQIWRLYQRLGVGNRIGLMQQEIERLNQKVLQLEELLDAPAPHTKAGRELARSSEQDNQQTKGANGHV